MFVRCYSMLRREQDWMIFVDMAKSMLLIVDDPGMNVVMIVEHNQRHSQEYVQRLLHLVDWLVVLTQAKSNHFSYVHCSNDIEELSQKRIVYGMAILDMILIGIPSSTMERMLHCSEMEKLMAKMMTDCLLVARQWLSDCFVSIVWIWYYSEVYDHQLLRVFDWWRFAEIYCDYSHRH